jgi:hypothetical protein
MMNILGKSIFAKSSAAFTGSARMSTLSLLLQGTNSQGASPLSTNAMLLLRTFSTVNKSSMTHMRSFSSQTANAQQAAPNEILESTADEVLAGGETEIVSKL